MRLKTKLNAIWAIITAESFTLNAVYPDSETFTNCSIDLPSDNDAVNETFIFVRRAFRSAWKVFIDKETEP